jgi:MscS family membrane protein
METTLERFKGFADLVGDVWNSGVLGIDLSIVITALGVFVFCMVFRGLFTVVVVARLQRWAARTENKLDDAAIAALEAPLRFVPIVVGLFFVKEIVPLSGAAVGIAEDFIRSLVAFVLFWIFFRLVAPIRMLTPQIATVLTDELVDWLIRGLKIAFVFLGTVTILEIWGIQVAPILAGLGLIGVAVALGAQDLFRNLIAGILIIGEQRFARGDWIKVDGVVEGTIESIGFRSTRVRQFDKAPIYVPNAKLSDNALVNYARMSHRRIYWMIGVEYGTTIEQLRQIRDEIEAFIADDGAFAGPPATARFVRIDRFSDSSIDIMVYCFTNTTSWGAWLSDKERLAYRIKEIVEGAGTGFAFPSRSVYLATGTGIGTGDQAEPFEPPERPNSGDDDPQR